MKTIKEIKDIFEADIKTHIHSLDAELVSIKQALKNENNGSTFLDENTKKLIQVLEYKMDEHRINKINEWSQKDHSKILSYKTEKQYQELIFMYLKDSNVFNKLNNQKYDLISSPIKLNDLSIAFSEELNRQKKEISRFLKKENKIKNSF